MNDHDRQLLEEIAGKLGCLLYIAIFWVVLTVIAGVAIGLRTI